MSVQSILDIKRLLICFVSISPSIITGILTQDSYYFLASLFAVSAIIPYGVTFSRKACAFLMFSCLFAGSILGSYLLSTHPYYFWGSILVVSLLLGFFEANFKTLKSLSAWAFIGVLYGSFELQQYPLDFTLINYITLSLLGFAGVLIFVCLTTVKKTVIKTSLIFNWHGSFEYCKYFLYFIIALIIFNWTNLHEPQWYFWSGLSVLNLNISDATTKLKHRISGGATGLLLGFLALHLLPANFYTSALAFIGIMLSLRSFKHYPHGFGVRCFCIVLFAANQGLVIGQIRFFDIVLGGLVGFVMSHVLAYLHQKLSA